MTVFLFANNASTTLAGPIASTATSLNLASGTGALFPQPDVGQQFALTLQSQSDQNVREIVYCTARSVDTCTVVRAQEGTPATAFIAGDTVANDLTAGTMGACIQASTAQTQPWNYGVDAGTVNALSVTLTPQPGSLALMAGAPVRVLVKNTNTGPTTLTIVGLPTTTVISQDGSALAAGQIVANEIYEFVYNPGVGFNVSSPYVLRSAANTWTAAQTLANNVPLNALTSGATSIPILNLNASNQTILRGGTNGSAPFVLTSSGGATVASTDSSNNFNVANKLNVGAGGVATGGGVAAAGNVSGNLLLANVGASSGNASAATLLADFPSAVGGAPGGSYVYQKLPSGIIIQAYTGQSPTGSDFITFPNPFPNGCIEVIACEGNPIGWNNGANPSIFGCQQLSRTSFALYVVIWNGSSWGLHAGVTYRYIAIGY